MKRQFLLVVSAVVMVFSFAFFIYPAVTICAVAMDPVLRKTGESRLLPRWFESASRRYASWARTYLETNYAQTLSPDDVAATEWPMFGSVYFLVTAEDLQKRGQIDASKGKVREAVDLAVRIVASPMTATWVKTKWGDTYLTKENVFYRMLLIFGLSSYESITGESTYHALMAQQRASLASELSAAKLNMLDDYPGECYPNDIVWAVAAIQRAARQDGTNHNDLATSLLAALDGPLNDENGFPAFQVASASGTILQSSRGCGNSGMLSFAAELDPHTATRWYRAYEAAFWKKTWWAVGFTEHPRGINQSFSDVDSGPVVAEFGSVASAFGIGASKTVGRFDQAAPVTMQAVACSWPTPFGPLVPGAMGAVAVKSWSLGEVALLFSMARPTYTPTTVPYEGPVPALVWFFVAGYAGVGVLFIGCEIRGCRRLLQKKRL